MPIRPLDQIGNMIFRTSDSTVYQIKVGNRWDAEGKAYQVSEGLVRLTPRHKDKRRSQKDDLIARGLRVDGRRYMQT